MIYILIFIIGLALGSFVNALVYRLYQGQPIILSRSGCPHCRHKLASKDLVPLFSFIILGGRCRYCKKKISFQYPLTELATAIVFVLVYWVLRPDIAAIAGSWIIAIFLVIIFLYDLKYYLILDRIALSAIVFALGFNLWCGVSFWNLLLAMIAGGGFFLVLYLISRGRWIGGGDLRLGVFAGAILGWPGVMLSIFLGYIFGALVATPLLLTGKKSFGSKLPFGTFLSAAIFVWMLWGEIIIDWYLGGLT
jgi:prepilin signal peptidase PulO-like enzyme (type II secretory pathway)